MPIGIYKRTEEHKKRIKEGIEESRKKGLSKSCKGTKRPTRAKEWSRKISEAKKGKSTWNKDKKLSFDHVKKISKSLTGRNLSDDHRKHIGISNLKDKNCNWIGGCSEYWAKEMKKIYTECILCASNYILEMHHMDNNNKNNDRLNRRIICKTCHEFWHHN